MVECTTCLRQHAVPPDALPGQYGCDRCGRPLSAPSGDASAFAGLVGGALLGAALWGPPGALIGGLLGAILGKCTKGFG